MSLGVGVLAARLDKLMTAQKAQNVVNFELVDEYEFKLYNNDGKLIKHYRPSKTALKFHASAGNVLAVKGPVGGGKSSFCLADIYLRAVKMPKCTDGVRRQRTVFVRNTYKDLLTSTFRTWQAWYNKTGDIGHIYERSAPWIYKRHTFNDKNGKIVLEIDGFSCDRPDQFESFSSVEFTTAYLNEARGLPEGILDRIQERLGRYPSVEECPDDFWRGIVLDTNAPSELHWFYKKFEIERPQGFVLFKQPPGLIEDKTMPLGYRTNPEAENLQYLPKDYYLNLIPGKTPEGIKVQLLGEYGTVACGRPVYPEYNDQFHFIEKALVINNCPIALGWDFGLTPAVVICQLTPSGRLLVHREITSANMGITQFIQDKVLPTLNSEFPQWRESYISVGDPAGVQRAQTDEKTCFQILGQHGIVTLPAITNNFIRRREAVAYFLCRFADGKPAFGISAKCPLLRSGFLGSYHYKEIKVGNEQAYKEEPEKNACSHPHDGLHYIALHFHSQTLLLNADNDGQYDLTRRIV